jgi:N4-gp56 family major capsid protein
MVKYGNTIFLTEELELMSVNARASKFMDTMGENAGASYNEILATVYSGATNIRYASGAAGTTSVIEGIVAADIKAARNAINRVGGRPFHPDGYGSTNIGTSPVRASYMGICHVDVEEDIRVISDFVPVESYGGYTETYPYEFGYSNGVRWCSTEEDSLIDEEASTTDSTSGWRGTSTTLNHVYSSYVVAMDAVGTVGLGENHTKEAYMTGDMVPAIDVVYAPPTVSVADPQGELGVLSWKGWLVGKILNSNWIVKIETLASDISL